MDFLVLALKLSWDQLPPSCGNGQLSRPPQIADDFDQLCIWPQVTPRHVSKKLTQWFFHVDLRPGLATGSSGSWAVGKTGPGNLVTNIKTIISQRDIGKYRKLLLPLRVIEVGNHANHKASELWSVDP